MMRTNNPALSDRTFGNFEPRTRDANTSSAGTMSVQGTVNKTAMLLALLAMAGYFTWHLTTGANPAAATPWVIGGAIGGLVLAVVTIFKPAWSMFSAPLYAIAEGLALGAISAMFEAHYQGIVFEAVGLTVGTLLCMLGAYSTGLIKVTEKFKLGVVAATGGIALVYFASFLLNMFGSGIPYIHSNGLIGIGFSIAVLIIAALNLVLDFDLIQTGVQRGAPRYMEWYGGFALLVTLVWLYIEFLHLLSKLRSR